MVEWGQAERRRMLGVIDVAAEPPGYEAICRLIRGWLFAVPFHNLDLLTGRSPLDQSDAASHCLTARGGGCHVHAAGFLALLRSLGYDANLASATIGAPGDHLVITVRLGGAYFWVDVGNGQPYIRPFPANRESSYSHAGWTVRTTVIDEGLSLERRSHDHPRWKQVYVTGSPEVRWDEFAETIRRHHTDRGFGPFLTGLRVVDIAEDHMKTVRDDVLTEHSSEGFTRKKLQGKEAVARAVREMLPKADDPESAIDVWWHTRTSARVCDRTGEHS